jgi:trimeric autotransporter adhesin
VALSSNNAAAIVPASVTVPEGEIRATFPIATLAVEDDVVVTLTGGLNGVTATATLTVKAPILVSLTVSPGTLSGGAGATGTVRVRYIAPSGGTVVTLSSSSAAVTVPATVTVPEGERTATFPIVTRAVSANVSAVIAGTLDEVTKTDTLAIKAPVLTRVSISPGTVVGGAPATGTIVLNGVAPAAGLVVALTSSSGAATLPASVTVPAGRDTVDFSVTTHATPATVTATISAAWNGVIKSDTLRVKAP